MTTTITVRFQKQGGAWIEGQANGRMGKQLRIAYRIQNGEARERWFPASRYQVAEGADVESLPRFKRQTCKAVPFEKPILAGVVFHAYGEDEAGEFTSKTFDNEADALGFARKNPKTGEPQVSIVNGKAPWKPWIDCDACGQRHAVQTAFVEVETGEVVKPWGQVKRRRSENGFASVQRAAIGKSSLSLGIVEA